MKSNVLRLPVKIKPYISERDEKLQQGILLILRLESIKAHGNPNEDVTIGFNKLKNIFDCEEPIFRKNLNFLIETGFIEKTNRNGLQNIYRVNLIHEEFSPGKSIA